MCINGDENYRKTIVNGAGLVRQKLKEHNLKIIDVKKHIDWYNTFCQEYLLGGYQGITWDDFIDIIDQKATNPSKPTIKPSKSPKLVIDGYMGSLTIKACNDTLMLP